MGMKGLPTPDLSFQRGVRYTYRYSTTITTTLHGSNAGKNGLALDCVVDIDVISKCHLMMQTDVYGTCISRYEKRGPILLKTRDLKQCQESRLANIWPHSIAIIEDTSVQSELHCVQRHGSTVMEEVNCTEVVSIATWSTSPGMVKTHTVSTLLLLRAQQGTPLGAGPKPFCILHYKIELHFSIHSYYGETWTLMAVSLFAPADSLNLGVFTHLQFVDEGHVRLGKSRVATPLQASQTVRMLCITTTDPQQVSQEFLQLAFQLRELSLSQLKTLWQESSFKCRNDWQPLLDALPACASENCVVLMMDLMRNKELEEEQTQSLLTTIALIQHPSPQIIDSINALLEVPEVRFKALLAGSSLVHQLCQRSHASCSDLPQVQTFIQTLEEILKEGCEEPNHLTEVLYALKSVGNAGLSALTFIPLLKRCVLGRLAELELRLASIQAFRRFSCSADLYRSSQEDPEVRIAAYQQLMHCPDQNVFEVVKTTLRNETSNQVGSYVWNHLTNVLRSEDPMKQSLIESLPDDIISRDFEAEYLKYSSYSDYTVATGMGVINLETSLIFSSKSFLPRSATANLTVYFNGRAHNLLEVDLHVENAEPLWKDFLAHLTSNFNGKSSSQSQTHAQEREPRRTRRKTDDGHRRRKEMCSSSTNNYLNQARAMLFGRRKMEEDSPRCWVGVKVFGNELSVFTCKDLYNQINQLSLSVAGLAVKLLKGHEVQLNHRAVLMTEELVLPSLSGLPLRVGINMTSLISLHMKGNINYRDPSHFSMTGYIKPMYVHITHVYVGMSARMGVDSALGQAAVEWVSELKSSTSLDGSVQVQEGRDVRVSLNTPEDVMDIISFSLRVFQLSGDHREEIKGPKNRIDKTTCTPKTWQLEQERNIKSGKLELMIDGVNYYIMGLVDTHTLPSEQRKHYYLEAKMATDRHPMILSANVTHGLGKRTSFSATLKNVFTETVSLSVALERRCDSSSRQYSVEAELLLPGVVGSRMLGLMEQKGSLWSSALRLKYGLGSDARNLHQECYTSQRMRRETDSNHTYIMRGDHEFSCSSTDPINHKFSLQAPEKNLNYRTQLQHSHLRQLGSESSTHVKINYNNLMPLVAGLHWKSPSTDPLQKKFEGTFNMDTPWLYIYTTHKLNQLQRHTLQLTSELTVSKWLTIHNLILEGFYRDRGRDREAHLELYTPAVIYLQAGGWCMVGKRSVKASYSLNSLWTPVLRGDISLESSKFSHTLQMASTYSKHNISLAAALKIVDKSLKKRQVILKATLSKPKSPSTELEFEGAVEELRKDKKMYQKTALLQLRETFTVDLLKGLYILESKAGFHGNREVIHTITLNYQPPSPFVCTELIHTFSSDNIPSDSEICVFVSSNQDIQGRLRVGSKERLAFFGQVQLNPLHSSYQEIKVKANFTHQLQLHLPSSAIMEGDVHWNPKSNTDFDYQTRGKLRIERQQCQMKATADMCKGSSSVQVRADGKERVKMDTQISHFHQRENKTVGLRMNVSQSLLPVATDLHLNMAANMSSDSVSLYGSYKQGQEAFLAQVKGSLKNTHSLQLAVSWELRHSMVSFAFLPPALGLDGTLEQSESLTEGQLTVRVMDTLYTLDLRHQEDSEEPLDINNEGGMMEKKSHRACDWLCVWSGEENLCVNVSRQQGNHGWREVYAQLSHSFQLLKAKGVPANSSAQVRWGQTGNRLSVLAQLWAGLEHLKVQFIGGKTDHLIPRWEYFFRLQNQVKALLNRGLTSSTESQAHYQLEAAGLGTSLVLLMEDEKMVDVLLNIGSKNNTAILVLSLWQQMELLQGFIPSSLQMNCTGDATADRLSAHCYGNVTGHTMEVQVFRSYRPHIRLCYGLSLTHPSLSAQAKGCYSFNGQKELRANLTHSSTLLLMYLGLPTKCGLRMLLHPGPQRRALGIRVVGGPWKIYLNVGLKLERPGLFNWRGLFEYGNSSDIHKAEVTGQMSSESWCHTWADISVALGSISSSLLVSVRCQGMGRLVWVHVRSIEGGMPHKSLLTIHGQEEEDGLKGSLGLESQKDSLQCLFSVLLKNQKFEVSSSLQHHWTSFFSIFPEKLEFQVSGQLNNTSLSGSARFSTSSAQMNMTVAWEPSTSFRVILQQNLALTGLPGVLNVRMSSTANQVQFELEVSRSDSCINLSTVLQAEEKQKGSVTVYLTYHPSLSLKASVQHTIEDIQLLGFPSHGALSLSTTQQPSVEAGLEVGRCYFRSKLGKTEETERDKSSYTLNTTNYCPALQGTVLPVFSTLHGLLSVAPCQLMLTSSLRADNQDLSLELSQSCKPQHLSGTLTHSFPALKSRGLPQLISIEATAPADPAQAESVFFKAETCHIRANRLIESKGRIQWLWALDSKCPLLQAHLNGSVWLDRGGMWTAMADTYLEGKRGILRLNAKPWPELSLEGEFNHNLPALRGLPERSIVRATSRTGKQRHDTEVLVQMDDCVVRASGAVTSHPGLQGSLGYHNNCTVIQEYGSPDRMQASGSLVVSPVLAKSQVSLAIDDKELQATVALKKTKDKNELSLNVNHSVQLFKKLGLPANAAVILNSESQNNDSYFYIFSSHAGKPMGVFSQLQSRALLTVDGHKLLDSGVNVSVADGCLAVQLSYSQPAYQTGAQHSVDTVLTVQFKGPLLSAFVDIHYHDWRVRMMGDIGGWGAHRGSKDARVTLKHTIQGQTTATLQLNQSESSVAGLVEVTSGRRRLWALGELGAIESGYRQALEIKHSYPQLRPLPRMVAVRTVYEARNWSYQVQHGAVWGNQEFSLSGLYSAPAALEMGNKTLKVQISCIPRWTNLEVTQERSLHGRLDSMLLGWTRHGRLEQKGLQGVHRLQVNFELDKVSPAPCPSHTLLVKVQTNLRDHLEHTLLLGLCPPRPTLSLSGSHRVNSGEELFYTQSRLSVTGRPYECSLTLGLINSSTAQGTNISLFSESRMGNWSVEVGGSALSWTRGSGLNMQVRLDHREKIWLSGTVEGQCVQTTAGPHLRDDLIVSACVGTNESLMLNMQQRDSSNKSETVGSLSVGAAKQRLVLSATGCLKSLTAVESTDSELLQGLTAVPLHISQRIEALLGQRDKGLLSLWKNSLLHRTMTDSLPRFLSLLQHASLMGQQELKNQALLVADQFIVTFDGHLYELPGRCPLLLAQDTRSDPSFMLLLSSESHNFLLIDINNSTISIQHDGQVKVNCNNTVAHTFYRDNGVTVRRGSQFVQVFNQNGVSVSCDLSHEMKPECDRSPDTAQHFLETSTSPVSCAYLFSSPDSPLSSCFRVVDPGQFLSVCELSSSRAPCRLASAFVHLCQQNYIPLEVPVQCCKLDHYQAKMFDLSPAVSDQVKK
ncbi:putative uncharacterized protein LOC400499 [Channa argus]|uniref:Vitellogenin domain-containing protein n=1 Tax=Channa argus TaxID=215402 RepID=A0A6G1Q903_CHAAH|nr:putative uncharacterized protein LOC400499 [Channa argus]